MKTGLNLTVRWEWDLNPQTLAGAAFRERFLTNSEHPTNYSANTIIFLLFSQKMVYFLPLTALSSNGRGHQVFTLAIGAGRCIEAKRK